MSTPEAGQPGLFKRLVQHIVRLAHKLFDLKDHPHSIAGGVAIGMFIGFTPLFGIKTLLSLGLALMFRCNPIAAVISVSLHDVMAPFWPFVLVLEYDIGTYLTHVPHVWPKSIHFHAHPGDLLKWTTFVTIGRPLLIGALVIGTPVALVSYALTLWIITLRDARRARRLTTPTPSE